MALRQSIPGFTLVELLVSIAIIAVLISILLPTLSGARGAARLTRDLAAAHQLAAALMVYANESQGRLVVGYASKAMVNGPMVVRDDEGQRLKDEVAQRYPWRLAPALDFNFRGLYSDDKLLAAIRQGREDYTKYGVSYPYIVSLFPSFGINATFIGGNDKLQEFDAIFRKTFGRVYLDRIDEAVRPSKVMAFVSARCELQTLAPGLGAPQGFFRVDPPYFAPGQGRRWEPVYDPNSDSPGSNSGYVSLRHNGRAASSMLDGHAEALGWADLGDMRRWADRADRADWTISPR